MRPLELRLRDFKSYRGKDAVFDFRGRRLVGIVGPIGSGKSSILDAISFALYGRVSGVKGTSALIHQRADGAAVSLRFVSGGEIWEVTRAIRRQGQSQHALYRLGADDDGEPVDKITMKTNVDKQIVQTLGLDFDAFTKSVLLAQGRFAEFLEAGPAERDKVLKGVFGHDRIDAMRQAAKDTVAKTTMDIERLTIRLEDTDRQAERLDANRTRLATLDKRLELLQKVQPRIADLESAIDASEASIKRFAERLSELDALAARLPDAATTATMLDLAGTVETKMAGLQDKVVAAEKDLAELLEAEPPLDVERSTLEAAAELMAVHDAKKAALDDADDATATAHQRLEKAKTEVVDAEAQHEKALARKRAAAEGNESAQEAHDVAARALHDARHAEMAATLAADLEKGEDCPVCQQSVLELPPSIQSPNIQSAEQAAAGATEALVASRELLNNALASVAAAAEGVERARAVAAQAVADHAAAVEKVKAVTTEIATAASEIAELLGTEEIAAELDRRRAELKRRVDSERKAREVLEAARKEITESQLASAEAKEQLDSLRVRVVELATRLGMDSLTVGTDPERLGKALDEVRGQWGDQRAAARASAEEATAARAVAAESLKDLFAESEIVGSFSDEMSRTAAEAAVLHRDIQEATARLEAVDSVRAERAALEVRAAAYARVAGDLTDSRFVRYLLDDERARLAELGSEHFSSLTGGRYRFSEDGAFQIVDLTAADAVRAAESLSGGETFLASLGLALALAEMVAREGSRLDSFFLDEGFGSLDPEHLDLAMEGIERLVASSDSRFVAVVSHVPEMRQRIEDLIRLDRDAVTGNTQIIRS
ncbi:MAG: SMC family ATPase [Acidimicrobiia bacterium]|nr:SMC family ATPase [Acidimicrobiia bacterium]